MHSPYKKLTAYILLFSQMLMSCLNPIVGPDKNSLEPSKKSTKVYGLEQKKVNTHFGEAEVEHEETNLIPDKKEMMVVDWVDQTITSEDELKLEKLSSDLCPLSIQLYTSTLSEQKESATQTHEQNSKTRVSSAYQNPTTNQPARTHGALASHLISTNRALYVQQRINQARRAEVDKLVSIESKNVFKRDQHVLSNNYFIDPTGKQDTETDHALQIHLKNGIKITLQQQTKEGLATIIGKLPSPYFQAKIWENLEGFSRELILPVYGEPGLLDVEKLAKQGSDWYKRHIHVCWPEKDPQGYVYIGAFGLVGGGNEGSKGGNKSSGSNQGSSDSGYRSTSQPPIYSANFRPSLPTQHLPTEYLPYHHSLYTPPRLHTTTSTTSPPSSATSNSFTHIPYSFVPVGSSSHESTHENEVASTSTLHAIDPTNFTTSSRSTSTDDSNFTHIPYSFVSVGSGHTGSFNEGNTICMYPANTANYMTPSSSSTFSFLDNSQEMNQEEDQLANYSIKVDGRELNPDNYVLNNPHIAENIIKLYKALVEELGHSNFQFQVTGGDRYEKNGKVYSSTNHSLISESGPTHLRGDAVDIRIKLADGSVIALEIVNRARKKTAFIFDPNAMPDIYENKHYHLQFPKPKDVNK